MTFDGRLSTEPSEMLYVNKAVACRSCGGREFIVRFTQSSGVATVGPSRCKACGAEGTAVRVTQEPREKP